MSTTPDFEARAREILNWNAAPGIADFSALHSAISSALLRAFELGCQAGHSAACEPSSSLRSSSSENGGEAKWQLISTAPKDGRKCLVGAYVGTIGSMKAWCVGIAWYSEHKKCWLSQTWDVPPDEQPTHWQPLPLPPALSPIEEAGTADEVRAANTAASLTPHQEEA